MIHINLNMIFYTQVEHSQNKSNKTTKAHDTDTQAHDTDTHEAHDSDTHRGT